MYNNENQIASNFRAEAGRGGHCAPDRSDPRGRSSPGFALLSSGASLCSRLADPSPEQAR
jgi:hypothetical protein